MSFFTIPKRYKYPIIVAAIIRDAVDIWELPNARRVFFRSKFRDYENENRYYELEREFVSLENFCTRVPFNVVLKDKDGLRRFPGGPDLYFDIEKNRVIFKKSDLYWIPTGIEKKGTTVVDLLTQAKLPDREKADWEGQELDFETILDLEDYFQIKIEVWTRYFVESQKKNVYKQYYMGSKYFTDSVIVHFQEETNVFFVIDDDKKYFEKLIRCPNKNCFFDFRNQKLFEDHFKLCGKSETKIIQEAMGPSSELLEKAERHGLVPKCGFNKNFLFFDIESVLPSSDIQTAKTTVSSTHVLVSIAANRFVSTILNNLIINKIFVGINNL